MNENIDLTKILEGCPEGTKFYSSIYGNVCFIRISHLSSYPIELMGCTKTFKMSTDVYTTKEGLDKHNFNGECTLFPSKDQRDWSKFVRFWDKSKKEKFDVNTLQGNNMNNIDKLKRISTPAEENWFKIAEEWEKEDK